MERFLVADKYRGLYGMSFAGNQYDAIRGSRGLYIQNPNNILYSYSGRRRDQKLQATLQADNPLLIKA
jgi:hypothetical protein